MLLILTIQTNRNAGMKDFVRIKRGIEKMGFTCHIRPDIHYPKQIIIEGADTWPEIKSQLEGAFR